VENVENDLEDVKTSVKHVENLVNADAVRLRRVEYELESGMLKIK
jgi:hypothetical protein